MIACDSRLKAQRLVNKGLGYRLRCLGHRRSLRKEPLNLRLQRKVRAQRVNAHWCARDGAATLVSRIREPVHNRSPLIGLVIVANHRVIHSGEQDWALKLGRDWIGHVVVHSKLYNLTFNFLFPIKINDEVFMS
jgi:hypothetical protein